MRDESTVVGLQLQDLANQNAQLREQLKVLEERRSQEMASFQRTYDKMLGEELRLKEELAKKPTSDANVVTALRQLATHVITFIELYDPKMLEGDYDSARRLRDIRDRARAALEHVAPAETTKETDLRGPLPAPSTAQAKVLAKIGRK